MPHAPHPPCQESVAALGTRLRRSRPLPLGGLQHCNSIDFAGLLNRCPARSAATPRGRNSAAEPGGEAASRGWGDHFRRPLPFGLGPARLARSNVNMACVRKASVADRAQAGRAAVPIFSPWGAGLSFTNTICRTSPGALLKLWVARRKTGSICPREECPRFSVTAWTGPPAARHWSTTRRGGNHAAGAGTGPDGQALCVTEDLPVSRRHEGYCPVDGDPDRDARHIVGIADTRLGRWQCRLGHVAEHVSAFFLTFSWNFRAQLPALPTHLPRTRQTLTARGRAG